ncbi:MAG: hypothetical protein M3Y87_30435 [Myxococcota bacterium]|nr:hypothetical protein [Myxococcota bacterium]
MRAIAVLLVAFALVACGGSTSTNSSTTTTTTTTTAAAPDDAHGGRLFDSWASETASDAFAPDDSSTPGQADGRGGARGDGTLLFADGRALLNDDGHDYRLKNLFGWDLRGRDGVYGPAHMNKSYALATDLLSWTGDGEAIADRLERGDDVVPAFGPVLSRGDLEAIAAFVVGVRDGALPHPDAIYVRTTPDAGSYALLDGGDAARGHAMFAERCASCHGDDGTALLFDEGAYSLGSHARQKAYEDWLKILNGQPGTAMGRQLRGEDGDAMAQELLDLFAALCDRTRFPVGAATRPDVPDADPRCGAYLR